MFNNPIKKYQSGGKATPEQEQQIAQLFEAASKNTGIDVETLMNAANQMPDENSIKQYVQAISMAAQGDQSAISSIKKMFSQKPAMQKLGGKILAFICKHAKGGQIADCGCGSKVPKAEMGDSGIGEAPVYYYNEKGVQVPLNKQTTRPGRMLYMEEATPAGKATYLFNDLQKSLPENAQLNLPVEYGVHTVNFLDDPENSMAVHPLTGFARDRFYGLKNQWTKKQENGGVIKDQEPAGTLPEPNLGEIRPASTTNPIRHWIDRTIDNNSALRTASRYARNFGNSAMGKVLGFFMPDTENTLASAPGFKMKFPKNKGFRMNTAKNGAVDMEKFHLEYDPATGTIFSTSNFKQPASDFESLYRRFNNYTGKLLDDLKF